MYYSFIEEYNNKSIRRVLMSKKYRKRAIFILLFSYLNLFTKDESKHIIGTRDCGVFSNFIGVLNHLDWCLKHDRTPVVYWGKKSTYYVDQGHNGSTNVWKYYFEQVSHKGYQFGDKIDHSYSAPDKSIIWKTGKPLPDEKRRKEIYEQLIRPFIKINPLVRKKIEQFYSKKMTEKHIVGVHLRGTDKSSEVAQVSPLRILKIAQEQATPESQFFVATDDNRLLETAKKVLQGKVIYYDSYRSDSGKPIHKKYNKALIGEEVVIEVMLLARCDVLVHTDSNVSISSLLLNPNLESIFLSVE